MTDETITVIGVGSSTVTPDRAVANVTIAAEAATVREAVDVVTAGSVRLREIVAAVPTATFATTGISISTPWREAGQPKAYAASYSVTVTIADIARAGALVDAMAVGVGDALQIHSLAFEPSDTRAAELAARRAAVAAAREQAETIAAAAGCGVAELVSASEQSGWSPYPGPRGGLTMAAAEVMPSEPGASDVAVQVTCAYRIVRLGQDSPP
jgi:uncharacterized protein